MGIASAMVWGGDGVRQRQHVALASLLHRLDALAPRADDAGTRGGADAGRWREHIAAGIVPDDWPAETRERLFRPEPADYISKLVLVADRLAGGTRAAPSSGHTERAPQLASIFSRIRGDGEAAPAARHYLPLKPLQIAADTIFPQPDEPSDEERRAAYRHLWDGFTAEIEHLPRGDFDSGFESLYYLLQKYTWAVPATAGVGEVSFFDHARTTCAIAAALDRAGTPEADLDALLAGDEAALEAERLLLVGGDVTGVQAFLYTITARGAARGLRGRSFYLQLLGEAIARWLLRELELPLASLLYVGGGRFYILAPHLAATELAARRQHLDRALLRCHQGDLYVALGAVPFAASALLAQREAGRGFAQVWTAVGQALNEQKRRKFAALPPAELHDTVFAPRGEGGSQEGCSVCRREGPYDRAEPDEERKCRLCASLEDLGRELRSARYLYLGRVTPATPEGPARSYRDALRAFGMEPRLFADAAALTDSGGPPGAGTLFTLGSTDFLSGSVREVQRAAPPGLGLGYYLLAEATPRQSNGAIAEFVDLARAARGVQRIGVLRMDVDDLGAMFSRGLGEGATLAQAAHLSFLLRLYFEGWLAELARRHNALSTTGRGADRVYVIYSGGDDLFLVGAWDQMPELALEIQRDFQRFAANNPAVHLSGGIVLEDERFPLYQAAEQAGEALERAKAREAGGRVVKSALDFLGETASWEDIEAAARRVDELRAMIEQGGVPRTLVHTLGRIYRLYGEAREQPSRRHRELAPDQVPYGRWTWVSAYTLTRLSERVRSPWREQLRGLPKELLHPQAIRTLGLAARWAELLLRRESGA